MDNILTWYVSYKEIGISTELGLVGGNSGQGIVLVKQFFTKTIFT